MIYEIGNKLTSGGSLQVWLLGGGYSGQKNGLPVGKTEFVANLKVYDRFPGLAAFSAFAATGLFYFLILSVLYKY